MIEKIKYKLKKIQFNSRINKADVLVWDYDGTLYHNDVIVEKLKDAYIECLKKQVEFKVSKDWFDLENLKHGGWAKTVAAYTNQPVLEIINLAEKNFKKHIYLKKNQDLVEKIETIKNKKHIILSNSKVNDIRKGLKKIGFKNIDLVFSVIIGRDNCQNLKPSVDAFKDIQKITKLPFYKHLMIGDSFADDIEPAKKAGFKAMHIDELNHFWKIHKKN